MTQYSYAQLEQLWINAGGSKALAPTMAAIAEAESSGNSNAYNASGASGLWQILGAVNPADQPQLFNPTVNAHEAVLKYKSQGLGAWTTYTSGAYQAFLNGNTTPDKNVPTGGGAGGTAADLTAAHDDCLWFITYPGGTVGGWIGGALGAATGQGGAGLASPAAGQGGGTCLFSKGEARAFLGGLMLVGGAVTLACGRAHPGRYRIPEDRRAEQARRRRRDHPRPSGAGPRGRAARRAGPHVAGWRRAGRPQRREQAPAANVTRRNAPTRSRPGEQPRWPGGCPGSRRRRLGSAPWPRRWTRRYSGPPRRSPL